MCYVSVSMTLTVNIIIGPDAPLNHTCPPSQNNNNTEHTVQISFPAMLMPGTRSRGHGAGHVIERYVTLVVSFTRAKWTRHSHQRRLLLGSESPSSLFPPVS